MTTTLSAPASGSASDTRGRWSSTFRRRRTAVGLSAVAVAFFALHTGTSEAAPPSTETPSEAEAPSTESTESTESPDSNASSESIDEPAQPEADAGPSEPSEAADAPPTAKAEQTVLDATLPCGLRVLVARDTSLPVAAVVLAVEVGTSDDPPELPGLHHALAYQLQQGNRDLRPDGIVDAVHAMGGIQTMAVGARQTRFESLVPAVHLDRVVELELLRMRAPTVNERRWRQSVGRARADARPRVIVDPKVIAEVWHDDGLAHGRGRPASDLSEMPMEQVGQLLAKDFEYAASTLVVVSPEAPQGVLERIQVIAEDLPKRPRTASIRPLPESPPDREGPAQIAHKAGKGRTFVWPVDGTAEQIFVARVLCGALNRQKAASGEPPEANVRCVMQEDPRRPVMSVRVDRAPDPAAVLRSRLGRLAQPTGVDASLVESQRQRQDIALVRISSSPLGLARLLAFGSPRGPSQGVTERSMRSMTGAAAMSDPNVLGRLAPHLLDLDRASQIVAAGDEAGSGTKPTASDDAPERPFTEDEPDPDVADPREDVH